MDDIEIRDFKVDIPTKEVDRLHHKLQDTRLPAREIVPNIKQTPNTESGNEGPRYEWAQEMLAKWTTEFDWMDVQKQLNQYPHYLAMLEQVQIHFLHARAEAPDATSLLLVHGWPGSFYEFSRVWDPLSHPADAANGQAFHVVVPSMSGFCWSDWPPRACWILRDTAQLFDKLMRKLGYSKYMVQCGDWGHFVGRELGAR
ncbi:epoxide hydrolase [Aspergillus sp. HF37]|nr:epoxide hydrolase [Aspergillus sp. HF37]